MTRSVSHRNGTLLALAAAIGFALQAIFATYAYETGMDPITLLVLRFILSAGAFWAIIAVRRPEVPAARFLLGGLALGLVPFALESASFFLSLQYIDAGLAELLFYLSPVIVVAVAILRRRESPSPRRLGALGIALGGIVLVLAGGAALHPDPVGIGLALLAAFGYAAFVLGADHLLDHLDPFLLAALVFTGAAISLTAFGTADSRISLDFAAAGWIQVALLVIVSTIVAETAFLVAMRQVGAGTASILSLLEPVVVAGLAWILFAERLAPLQLVGGALVLGAIVLLAPRGTTVVHVDDPAAFPTATSPARAVADEPAHGRRLGLRAQVGRVPRPGVRRRHGHPPAVAQR